eukprot:789513-Pelagomonas_calceolata.AAC.12
MHAVLILTGHTPAPCCTNTARPCGCAFSMCCAESIRPYACALGVCTVLCQRGQLPVPCAFSCGSRILLNLGTRLPACQELRVVCVMPSRSP